MNRFASLLVLVGVGFCSGCGAFGLQRTQGPSEFAAINNYLKYYYLGDHQKNPPPAPHALKVYLNAAPNPKDFTAK